jgi:serine/threonine protein kinase
MLALDGAYPFIIMKRYGSNLKTYFEKCDQRMSKLSVLAVGRGLLREIQKVHEAGYTHNDIKPSNILVGYNADPSVDPSQNVFKSMSLHLTDFGTAKKYLKDNN